VDGLTFHVPNGQVYALLGPNGAGKTTSLRMLATLASPDNGVIRIQDVDIHRHPLQARKALGYVPAEAGLPERLSASEVVRLYARIQGVAQPNEVTERLLDQLRASSYAQTPCGDLSTGMKRRVVLARALVHEPPVLLLDEPTDGLDVGGRQDVLALIRAQAAAGRAIVISSHIMAEVERVADRIGVMTQGRLVAEGTVAELLQLSSTTSLDDAFLQLVDATAPDSTQ